MKIWEVFGWVRLVIQTLLDLWIICTLINYYRELDPRKADGMPGVNKEKEKKGDEKPGDVEMVAATAGAADGRNQIN